VHKKLLTFISRPFIRSVAKIATGAAAAQAISMLFAPIITRLYGPEAYGIQGAFVSATGILGTVAAMSYPIAIVLPKSDIDALWLARLSLFIGSITTGLVTVLLYFLGQEILNLLNLPEISLLMYLIPVSMFISVLSRVVGQWLIRKKAFSLTAKVTVYQSLWMNTIKAGLGFVHPAAAVLVITNAFGGLITAMFMLLGLRKKRRQINADKTVTTPQSSMTAVAIRHWDFALLRTPQEFLNIVSQSLPVVMLASYFGPTAVGFYSISAAVLSMPAGLIGTSVMQVFYPRINEAIHGGENARDLIVKATAGLALTGALPFGAVIIGGPLIFSFVFGSEWKMAGIYAQWLAPWLFFQYINKPAVSAIPALKLQGGLLVYELFSTGTKFLALYLGYVIFESDIIAIALFSIFGVAAYAWLILWVIFHSCKIQENRGR